MVMALRLAKAGTRAGDNDSELVFKRLGLVSWARKELFVCEDISTIKIVQEHKGVLLVFPATLIQIRRPRERYLHSLPN